MLNQDNMWHDAFRLKLPVYVAAEVKHCIEKKQHLQHIFFNRKLICNYFDSHHFLSQKVKLKHQLVTVINAALGFVSLQTEYL